MNSFQWHIVKLKHRALLSSLIVAAAFIPFSSTTAGTANPPTIQKTPELARQVNETLNFDHKTEDILKTLTESKNPSDKTLMGAFYGSGAGGKQDWGKARMWFEKAASEGDAHAEYFLGLLYMGGLGTPKDYDKAFHWLLLAARKDIPDAQYQLSWFYANGKGTSQSLRETVYWIQKAAHKGHVVAMRSMGMLSYSGLGMPENKVDAFKWFEKAASAGDAEAQYHLGMSYMAGKGTEKDGKKGKMLRPA